MAPLDFLLSLLIPTMIMVHLLIAPYTKVEESFNMQATHDILVYGMPTKDVFPRLSAHYDHFDFPGAVPRTFVGSLLLAGTAQPMITVFGFRHAQLIVRAILGLFNASAILLFKSRLERGFGKGTARWYAILQATQFHVLFYASRLLPNMFAFGLTTLAFAQLLPSINGRVSVRRSKMAIVLLTTATAVFRSELAILLTTTTLYGLVKQHISLRQVIPTFILAFVFSLAISVPIDSYFWQRLHWPELSAFYFNAIQGSSSEWGTSPWHYYFTSALPKVLANPMTTLLLPFACFHSTIGPRAQSLAIPSLAFVAIYSLQPHKEARFIFYVVPPLTAVAAMGADYISSHRQKLTVYTLGTLILAGSILVSLAVSTALLIISSLNYPGGEALAAMWQIAEASSSDFQSLAVHTDVLSCMTGVTLFGQHPSSPIEPASGEKPVSIVFDKTEDNSLELRSFWEKFDYVLVEDLSKPKGDFEVIGEIEGFDGAQILKPGSQVRESEKNIVLGKGQYVRHIRDYVRRLTGGWWVGPRMTPKIRIMRKVREREDWKVTAV